MFGLSINMFSIILISDVSVISSSLIVLSFIPFSIMLSRTHPNPSCSKKIIVSFSFIKTQPPINMNISAVLYAVFDIGFSC